MKELEQVLAQCIDDICLGRASIEDCLERYPRWRQELGPLLELAVRLPPAPDMRPSSEFRARARLALQQEIRHSKASVWRKALDRTLPLRRVLPVPMLALSALLLVLLASGGLTYAAQDSLPGQALYPIKTSTEHILLLVTFNSARKAEYHLELAERRVQEMVELASMGQPPGTDVVQAVAAQVDAALAEVRSLGPDRARAVLNELSEEIGQRQALLGQGTTQPPESLAQTRVVWQRGQIIAQGLAEDPNGPAAEASVQAAIREAEVKGPVSNVDPLEVAGLVVRIQPGASVRGELQLGKEARVKGRFIETDTLQASSVEVAESASEDEEDSRPGSASSSRSERDDNDPRPVAQPTPRPDDSDRSPAAASTPGVKSPGDNDSRTEGADSAEAPRGNDNSDGKSAGAQESRRTRIELRGVITREEPLTIARRIVVIDDSTEVQGTPRVGLIAEVEGYTNSDGSIQATEIKVERLARKTEVRGTVVSLAPLTVGSTVVVLVPSAEVKGELSIGVNVRAEGTFQADGRFLASTVKVNGPKENKGKGNSNR